MSDYNDEEKARLFDKIRQESLGLLDIIEDLKSQLAALEAANARMAGLLRRLEWSGTHAYHAGVGTSTTRIEKCPQCGGINPGDPQSRQLNADTHGHREHCSLKAELEALNPQPGDNCDTM